MTNKEKIGRLQDHIDRHSKEPHAFYINEILNEYINFLISKEENKPLKTEELKSINEPILWLKNLLSGRYFRIYDLTFHDEYIDYSYTTNDFPSTLLTKDNGLRYEIYRYEPIKEK